MDWERLREVAADTAGKVADAAGTLVEKGRRQVDVLALENRLHKAQQQLGALVYSLASTGEDNPELVRSYIETIAAVEKQLEQYKKPAQAAPAEVSPEGKVCPQCGAEAGPEAMFCSGCGAKL